MFSLRILLLRDLSQKWKSAWFQFRVRFEKKFKSHRKAFTYLFCLFFQYGFFVENLFTAPCEQNLFLFLHLLHIAALQVLVAITSMHSKMAIFIWEPHFSQFFFVNHGKKKHKQNPVYSKNFFVADPQVTCIQ